MVDTCHATHPFPIDNCTYVRGKKHGCKRGEITAVKAVCGAGTELGRIPSLFRSCKIGGAGESSSS